MTTTAQPVSNLDAPAADAMDTFSDVGFEMGDGDGDIDLDLGASHDDQHQQDDALSLQDAATDGGVDLQTGTGDQDDFMVDKDDLIEEDEIDYGDLELGDAGQTFVADPSDAPQTIVEQSNDSHTDTNVQPNASNDSPIEDDIIDYSDDEEEQAPTTQDAGSNTQQAGQEDGFLQEGDQEHSVGDNPNKILDQSSHDEQTYEYEFEEENVVDGNAATGKQWQEGAGKQPTQQEYHDGPNADENHGYNQEQSESQGERNGTKQDSHDEQNDDAGEDHDSPDEDAETEAEEPLRTASSNQRPVLHPVTVNYDGTEMWLFKPRDIEGGEWLLTDESVATQQFPYLFQACRTELGDDLPSETELGLRFDHFHALELFEDCTACAYTTLKELLDVYLSLHAQDGLTDPEPFYITLQFRPRVLTLVNELKKAVQDQIGFSGLNDAVASGETSFNAYLSNHTEQKWEDSKHEGAGEEKIAGDARVTTEKDNEHDGHEASRSNSMGTSSGNPSAPGSQDGEEPEEEPEEEELIDYSEDEGDVDNTQPGHASTNGPSSTSSTVQGDDASYADADETNAAENQETKHSSDEDDDLEDNLDDPTDFGASNAYAQYDVGNDASNSGHIGDETLDQAYDQGFDTGDFLTQNLDNNDGYYYDNDANVSFDQQADFSLTGDADNAHALGPAQQNAPATGDNSFAGVDDFLDLTGDNGDDPNDDAFALPALGDEGQFDLNDEGVTEQASITASLAVPPAVASSSGLDDQGSPQGQKRSIDEVDIGFDGASETTDTKRPKV